jgi:hypothetical protein
MNLSDLWVSIDALSTYLWKAQQRQQEGLPVNEKLVKDAQELLPKMMEKFNQHSVPND